MTRAVASNQSSWHRRCHTQCMRRRSLQVFGLACIMIAAAATAAARTFPLEKITKGNQEFFGTVSYDVEKAYAGNHNLEVDISLGTHDTSKLELAGFDVPDQTKIQFREMSNDDSF